jgi:hypothetical protein
MIAPLALAIGATAPVLPAAADLEVSATFARKKLGVSLIPATAPDFFLEDTPTAVLVRQVLGANRAIRKSLVGREAQGRS